MSDVRRRLPARPALLAVLASSLRWAARRALPAAGATVLVLGAAAAAQAITAQPAQAAELAPASQSVQDGTPSAATSPDESSNQNPATASSQSPGTDEQGDPAAPTTVDEAVSRLRLISLVRPSHRERLLALAPVVDTVSGLTGLRLRSGASDQAPQQPPLLDLSNGSPDQAQPTPGSLAALLQGISGLVLPDGPGGAQPQPGAWQPAAAWTTPADQASEQPATTSRRAGGQTPADGDGQPTGGHPSPQNPLQPAPQPNAPQAPAGGSLGSSLSSGPGMAVAALFMAPLLLALAERSPHSALPTWKSAEVVAIIERPG
jgi:hypothetical protein